MLLAGAAIAVALGAAAALLRPSPPAALNSPTNIAIPVRDGDHRIEPREVHERMLEGLVEASRGTDRPDRIPAFSSLALLIKRDPDDFAWALQRLAEDDVPIALVTSFASQMPSRDRGLDPVVHGLLIDRLTGDDPEDRVAALDVLRGRGVVHSTAEGACRCAFGVYPRAPKSGERAWLLAWSLDGEGVGWAPAESEDGWLLNLSRGAPDGPQVRVQALDAAPSPPWSARGVDLPGSVYVTVR